MKPTLHEMERRDQPATFGWTDSTGAVYLYSDQPGLVQTIVPVGDASLPEYARLHPESFVGSRDLPFLMITSADGSELAFLGHVDAVTSLSIVYGEIPAFTTATTGGTESGGSTAGAGTTSSTDPIATGSTGTGGAESLRVASKKVNGGKSKGGGCYTSHGGIHVDHGHHAKHVKHHGKHK